MALPSELLESLLSHDGLTEWAGFLPEATPLSLKEIVEQYLMRMDVADHVDGFTVHSPNTESWWNELWIPFADNGGGDLQVIDQRPGPQRGRLGLASHTDAADFEDAWPSLTAYLTAVADALEHGGAVGVWRPVTEEGALRWELAR